MCIFLMPGLAQNLGEAPACRGSLQFSSAAADGSVGPRTCVQEFPGEADAFANSVLKCPKSSFLVFSFHELYF